MCLDLDSETCYRSHSVILLFLQRRNFHKRRHLVLQVINFLLSTSINSDPSQFIECSESCTYLQIALVSLPRRTSSICCLSFSFIFYLVSQIYSVYIMSHYTQYTIYTSVPVLISFFCWFLLNLLFSCLLQCTCWFMLSQVSS